jgi:hypothetical protein
MSNPGPTSTAKKPSRFAAEALLDDQPPVSSYAVNHCATEQVAEAGRRQDTEIPKTHRYDLLQKKQKLVFASSLSPKNNKYVSERPTKNSASIQNLTKGILFS